MICLDGLDGSFNPSLLTITSNYSSQNGSHACLSVKMNNKLEKMLDHTVSICMNIVKLCLWAFGKFIGL